MYSIGKNYKFEIVGRIFYTGQVIEEDESHVKIFTIRKEELILNKEDITQAKRIDDSIEGEY